MYKGKTAIKKHTDKDSVDKRKDKSKEAILRTKIEWIYLENHK